MPPNHMLGLQKTAYCKDEKRTSRSAWLLIEFPNTSLLNLLMMTLKCQIKLPEQMKKSRICPVELGNRKNLISAVTTQQLDNENDTTNCEDAKQSAPNQPTKPHASSLK